MTATFATRLSKALASADTAPNSVTERILDAAVEQFQLLGVRRSSMEDVAKRAGLSRITVYRRFPQKDRLVEAVVLRECQQLIADIGARIASLQNVEAQIEEAFVLLLSRLQHHPLATQLLAVEPESALLSLTRKAGPAISIGIEFIIGLIRTGQRSGGIPDYEPRGVAEVLARLAHSLFLTPSGGTPLTSERQARMFARNTVLPLIMHQLPVKQGFKQGLK